LFPLPLILLWGEKTSRARDGAGVPGWGGEASFEIIIPGLELEKVRKGGEA